MSGNILPQQKTPKLIVVVAFDPDEEGTLQTVFGPTARGDFSCVRIPVLALSAQRMAL